MASKNSERKKFNSQQAKTKERDLQAERDIADDVIESDFVPYASLYNPTTIVTKDGEVLQTIKITGTGFEATSQSDLRQAIRTAIKKAIPDDTYAIWLHTLRRRQVLVGRSHYPDMFSGQVDEIWRSQQPSSASYVNELYVTIVKAGESSALKNKDNLIQSLHAKRFRTQRFSEIDRLATMLMNTTQQMIKGLEHYGARLLSVVKRGDEYFSEHLEFLEKLINLEERPMPVPVRDLSHVLTSGEITFAHNAMEVRTEDGHRRFAAILTLKEYKESTLAGIDRFLEIPCEVIITQCFAYTGAELAQEAYSKQARYLSISGDKELAQWMEIDRLMQTSNAANTDREFGQQQTSLFLIASSVKQLEANVKLVQRSLSKLGMVVMREDLRFEECYWAQLPGNFPFVVRKQSVDTEHLAGFANLQSAPMGVSTGSAWGAPVSLFNTVQDAPYFFNFHRGKSAHTVVLGKPGSGRTSFTHLLLAQSRKLNSALWYVDVHGRGKHFIEAMGGTYLQPGTASLKFNPLQLADNPANREFLALWISTLIDPYGHQLNKSSLMFFQSLVDQVMQMPREKRRLSALLPTVREADPFLGATLQKFCAGGPYGELFDMPEDTFATSNLIGWDISRWYNDPAARIPLASYLLHRITAKLTGNPTIIVLDEGFTLLDTPLFAARASAWCDYLSSQNSACIFTTEAIEQSGLYGFTSGIAQKAATIFAMADAAPEAEYGTSFGLSNEEITTIAYNAQQGSHLVLQKRGKEVVVLKMAIEGMSSTMRTTLSGRVPKTPPQQSPADQLAALMGYKEPAA